MRDVVIRRTRHGNFGKELPVVYRWAYDYSVPGAADDFIPQTTPPSKARVGSGDKVAAS